MGRAAAERARTASTLRILVHTIMWMLCWVPLLADGGQATPAETLTVQDGFRVELLRSAQEGEGSWISMTFDDQGRLILGRDDVGLARLTLERHKQVPSLNEQRADVGITYELIETSLKHCRGVLATHGSLYVCATDSHGFYRLRDTDGNDTLDDVQRLQDFDYRSRYGHGANQIKLGPDNKLYIAIGNDVAFPTDTQPASPYRDPRNDLLLPSPYDAGQDDRVGFIARTDLDGRTWEIIAGGLRNEVDLAFNPDGELFTFDADMEWDVGLPWYRPIRINHIVSGGEYGWRWGTGKWPTYYPDSLPSTLDMGLGSPTGVEFGTHSNFPAAYREAMFAADWQNGRILLVQMSPRGATYQCSYQVFLEGAPLNVCDFTFGPDGALYFITGGRGSQSGLYRVTYAGGPTPLTSQPPAEQVNRAARAARQLRRQLESYHVRQDAAAIDFIWPHLDSNDRWIRFAARVALERQPEPAWRERAVAERRPWARGQALMALARVGSPADQPALLQALDGVPLDPLNAQQLLTALRTYALTFCRQGRPSADQCAAIARRLEAIYPTEHAHVNQELCELLIFLDSPEAVNKTTKLLETASTQEEQIHYADHLSRHAGPWSAASRRTMLQWIARSRSFRGGKLLADALRNIRNDTLQRMSDNEKLEQVLLVRSLDQPAEPLAIFPARSLVRNWTFDELLAEVEPQLATASPTRGKQLLVEATCLRCHRVADEGTPLGPDLTDVAKRYDTRSILQSVILPSAQIDPKYRDTTYELDNGQQYSGRVVSVSGTEIVIETGIDTGETVTLQRDAIEASFPAMISPMPTGLLNSFNSAEIADLLTFLQRAHGQNTSAADAQ